MYAYVHNGFTYSNQTLATTQKPIKRMEEQMAVYPYNEALHSNQRDLKKKKKLIQTTM